MPGCVLISRSIEFAVAAGRVVIAEIGAADAAAAERLMRGERILLDLAIDIARDVGRQDMDRAARRIFRPIVIEADGRDGSR